MDLPVHKKLPHTIPQWVAEGSWFFVPINCVPRRKNQLRRSGIGDAVLATIKTQSREASVALPAVPAHAGSFARRLRLPARAWNANRDQKLEEVCGGKTRRELATRFLRSSPARPSGSGREDELHPDEPRPQRLVRTGGRLGVDLSAQRPSSSAARGRASACGGLPALLPNLRS